MTTPTNSSLRSTELGLDFLADLLGFHLRVAQLRVFGAFTEAVGDPTVTPLMAGALGLIAANPGINQTDLAALLVADPSTMVRLIDQLEKRGWVVRETAAHDRRQTVPRLTDAGHDTLERLRPAIRASEDELAAQLDPAERADLIRLLRRLSER
jgi:DNA-binding MarR family transcriptional regulator